MDFSGFDPPDLLLLHDFSGFGAQSPPRPSILTNMDSAQPLPDFSSFGGGFDETSIPRPSILTNMDSVSDSMQFIPSLASSRTAHELNMILPVAPHVVVSNDIPMDYEELCISHDVSQSVDTPMDCDTLPTIQDVTNCEEDSIDDMVIPPPRYIAPEDQTVPVYTITYGTSKRGGNIIVDSLGYEYSHWRKTTKGLWSYRCVRRSKNLNCPAVYAPGRETKDGVPIDPRAQGKDHICQPGYKPEAVRTLRANLKRRGMEDMFEEAMVFVNNEIHTYCPAEDRLLFDTLPSDVALAAQINYFRRSSRPEDVKDLGFELDLNNIPQNFLQRDICIGSAARHIILATPKQLEYLSKAKTWYVDGTFFIVKDPFLQLFSVHVFIRSGTCIKQIPVAFVIMSRRKQEDYEEVFKALLQLVPQTQVKKVVLDFERAVWTTLRRMMSRNEFPKVTLKGCFFHFAQALYRRIGLLGLASQYKTCVGTKDVCRQMMALAFLPAEYVPMLFSTLKDRCSTGGVNLKKFAVYMEKNWINGWFTPADWVRFCEFVRTNNHTEGWHRSLNAKFKRKNVCFYMLVHGLHKEGINAHAVAQQVYQGVLTTSMTKADKERNEKLDKLWDKLKLKQISPATFLKEVAKKVRPQEGQHNSRIDLDADDLEDLDYDVIE